MITQHRDSLQQMVLPSYDAATREMTKQINSSFTAGLNDCKYTQSAFDLATSDIKLQSSQGIPALPWITVTVVSR